MWVWKFGGSSLADAQAIRRVTQLVERCAVPGESVVVCSAMAGVTDRLVRIAELVRLGSIGQALEDASCVVAHHRTMLGGLNLADEEPRAASELDSLAQELLSLVERAAPDSASAAWEDSVLSFGERLSVRVVAAALRQRGITAQAIDASTFLMTTGTFQNAEPLWNETRVRAQKVLLRVLENRVLPVVTGFIGAAPDGQITTLGRNSSGYSAAIVAHVLDAEEVCLWTDVDGVFDADPDSDKHPNWLKELSYEEALELAQNGARVLYPKMIEPLRTKNITLSIRNTFNPDHPGTRIGPVKGGAQQPES